MLLDNTLSQMRTYIQNGCCLTVICAGLILIAGCAGQNQAPQPREESRFIKAAKADFADWPDRIIDDSKDTFLRKDNLTLLLLAGGASIAMHNTDADDNIAENLRNHRGIDGFASEALNTIGNPGTHFAATGLWYAISANNQDDFNQERAWTMMTALSITGITTVGLKGIRNNDSPNGRRWAWPSGHTSSSFCVASVLDEFYGHKVGIPAYALATLVAYRMMDEGDHWASDVVFGAALGWVVGHTVAGKHKDLEIAGFRVLPYVASTRGPAAGVTLIKRF